MYVNTVGAFECLRRTIGQVVSIKVLFFKYSEKYVKKKTIIFSIFCFRDFFPDIF